MKSLLTDEIVFTPNGASQLTSGLQRGFSADAASGIEVGVLAT
jgi:hypothetical protein